MLSHCIASFATKSLKKSSPFAVAQVQYSRSLWTQQSLSVRQFAKKAAEPKKVSKQATKPKNHGVYMWAKMPRLGAKGGSVSQTMSMPKGAPQRITEFDALNVQKMQVGLRHSAVISADGELFTFGQGNWGVLGHGNEDSIHFTKPKLVKGLSKSKVVDVAMGEYHTIALCEDGNVYTWGYGGKKGFFNWMYTQEIGALGHGDVEPTFAPKKVSFFEENGLKVKQIAAGNYHCVVVCDDGNLYNWGIGLYGVLGNGSNQYALTPQVNEDFIYQRDELSEDKQNFGFRKISAADDYTAAVMNDGQIYVWGKNDFGQMGVGAGIGIDLVESENIPKDLDLEQSLSEAEKADLPFVTNVSTGMRTMMITDSKDRLYQTGLKIDWNPKHVKLNKERIDGKIELLGCGRNHYAFVDSGNNLHCFGTIVKQKAEEQYDGYGIYEGDELFEGNKIVDLQMKYETFGVLCEDK